MGSKNYKEKNNRTYTIQMARALLFWKYLIDANIPMKSMVMCPTPVISITECVLHSYE